MRWLILLAMLAGCREAPPRIVAADGVESLVVSTLDKHNLRLQEVAEVKENTPRAFAAYVYADRSSADRTAAYIAVNKSGDKWRVSRLVIDGQELETE